MRNSQRQGGARSRKRSSSSNTSTGNQNRQKPRKKKSLLLKAESRKIMRQSMRSLLIKDPSLPSEADDLHNVYMMGHNSRGSGPRIHGQETGTIGSNGQVDNAGLLSKLTQMIWNSRGSSSDQYRDQQLRDMGRFGQIASSGLVEYANGGEHGSSQELFVDPADKADGEISFNREDSRIMPESV